MKKFLLLTLIALSTTYSCIPDDSDSGGDPEGPITANIRFEVSTTRATEAVVTTTIDDATESEDVTDFPYSRNYANTEVEVGTFLRLTFLENGTYVVDDQGSNWTDYTAVLTIYVNNTPAQTELFTITEDDAGLRDVVFTFN